MAFLFPSAVLAVALVAANEPGQAVQPDRQIASANATAKPTRSMRFRR